MPPLVTHSVHLSPTFFTVSRTVISKSASIDLSFLLTSVPLSYSCLGIVIVCRAS